MGLHEGSQMAHYDRTNREFNAIQKLLPPQSKGNDVALFESFTKLHGRRLMLQRRCSR